MSGGKALALILAFASAALAHVGSPDVFFQGSAGPYPLLVTIRPPDAIPGVARVEIRALGPGVQNISITPTPMVGEAAKHPPVADIAERSTTDPQYFEGSLWLMTSGSWKVRVAASGAAGAGELQVPVSSVALRVKPLQKGVGYFLFGMLVFLTVGMVAIVGAAVREAQTDPGTPAGRWSRKSIIAMLCASVVLVFALWRGNAWWGEDAASSSRRIYRPLALNASLEGTSRLRLQLTDPGWLPLRKLDDLIPDHGHLMHLLVVRWPDMDRAAHLHPDETAAGYFETPLPALSAGQYRLYGDIVHDNGLAETAVGEITLPNVAGQPVGADDAVGPEELGNGYRMVWKHDMTQPIVAKQVALFSFEIDGPDGKPVNDLEPYMGMGGHAEFVKRDGSVFAHVHPTGSVPMASEAVASPLGMVAMHETKVGPVVSFPYGLPTPGSYRVFVQLKRAGKVVTGAFDVAAK